MQKPYWLFAAIPLAFGIQQFIEGLLWLEIGLSGEGAHLAGLGFIFFSHVFWLGWIPLASHAVEPDALRRKLFMGLALVGIITGVLMYVPLWLHTDWLVVEQVKHSIVYHLSFFFDGYMPDAFDETLYGLNVLAPLLLSSHLRIRIFGLLVMTLGVVAALFYSYAFISVWCFFAAILSIYLLYMILQLQQDAEYQESVE